jgi:hypothetical protein
MQARGRQFPVPSANEMVHLFAGCTDFAKSNGGPTSTVSAVGNPEVGADGWWEAA